MAKGRKWIALIIVASVFCAAGFAGAWKLRPKPESYMTQRSRFVTRLAHQFGQADAVVLGDSLTEETDFAGACGRTFVAGVGGARTAHLSAIAPEILDATQPKTIILAVGTNYFIVRDEINNMRAEYPPFARSLARRGRLILAGYVWLAHR